MRPIAADGVTRSVCMCVGHVQDHCKNGWTDQDAMWRLIWVGPKKHVLDWSQFFNFYIPMEMGILALSSPLKSIGMSLWQSWLLLKHCYHFWQQCWKTF